MVRAIRTISVERGHDPRRFALMPFGGAGPLHAREVARALGIRRVLVPAAPGILCAQGLVVSDLKEDFVAGRRLPVDPATESAIRSEVEALRQQAEGWFAREDVPQDARTLELSLDLRYVGQNFELAVPFEIGDLPDAAGLRAALLRGARDGLRLPQPARSGGGRELPPDRARPALPRAAAGEGRRARAAARAERAARGLVRPRPGDADAGLRADGAAARPARSPARR